MRQAGCPGYWGFNPLHGPLKNGQVVECRHAVLRRPCPPWREGSSPSLVTGWCCPGGERDIMAPSEGAGPGSTPGRGAVHRFDGERDITRLCEGRVPGSTPGWSTVAELKAAARPGCEPGMCGFDSRRPPCCASAARWDEHPSCKGARAGSSPAAGSGSVFWPGPREGIGALNLGRVGSTPTLAARKRGRRCPTGRAPPS